jgi:SAM-dependent methyltransferase
VAARAAERGADVVGGDFSQQMLAVARRLYPDIEFVQENAERLTFADAAFDAVVGNLVLLHLPQPEAGVAEMVRVLRPGGGLALTVWDAAERSRFTGIFLDAVAAAGASAPAGFPTGPSPVLYADDAKFARLLASAGLGDVVVERVSAESRYDNADELWEGFLASSVRIAALIHGQSTEIRAAIRREFDRLADEAISDGAIRLPAVVCLASGTKGSA